MSGFSVRLTKDGLRREHGGGADAFVPDDVFDLLSVWHGDLEEIDPDYTLGDLVSLLRGVDGIERLEGMLWCEVGAFLAEAAAEPAGEPDADIRYLEVYNTAALTAYEEDPGNPDEPTRIVDDDEAEAHDAVADALSVLIGEPPPFRIVDASEDDPITGKPVHRRVLPGRRNGTWVGPYRLDRGFRGWGRWEEPFPAFFAASPGIGPATREGGIALDFRPVNELAHLPLRYNPAVAFHDGRPGGGSTLFRDRITITFGELVHAVFWELGFMGSPEARDAGRALLDARVRELKEALDDGDGEPWR